MLLSAINALTKMTYYLWVTCLPMAENQPKPKNRRVARRQNLQKFQKDQVERIAGNLKGSSAASLINAYANKQNVLHDQVMDKIANLQGSITGLTKASINRIAYQKAGVKNLRELKAKLQSENIDISNIPDRILVELVALDDWGTIFRTAWPLIQKYGPVVLSHLYSTYVKPKVDKWMGGDEGINPVDWGGVLGPRRFTPVPGENVHMMGIRNVASNATLYENIDGKSIRSVICPELFKYRYAFTQPLKTALAVSVSEYSITTNASGNVGVILYPYSITAAGSAATSSFLTVFNDSTFSLSTGTQTASATLNAGPLNSSVSAFEAHRLTTFSIQIIPTASFNTAGSFTLSYKNRNTGTNFSATNISTTLVQAKNWPYTTSFNNKTIVRMITVPGDPSEDEFKSASSSSYGQAFVLLGSGLPASTEACKVVLNAVDEFIPTMDYLPVCAVDLPGPGPLTEQLETMMFARFPVLQMLDLVDAKRIAESIPDGPINFDQALQIISEAVSGIVPHQYVPHTTNSSVELPGSLPELIME